VLFAGRGHYAHVSPSLRLHQNLVLQPQGLTQKYAACDHT
jgi:hypothetical protein